MMNDHQLDMIFYQRILHPFQNSYKQNQSCSSNKMKHVEFPSIEIDKPFPNKIHKPAAQIQVQKTTLGLTTNQKLEHI